MHIKAEDRQKKNEVVILRGDVAAVVLYHPHDFKVVLVKEFRSPVRNTEGYVYELPGGSSTKDEPIEQIALHEVEEELGFKLDPARLRSLGERQIGATMSAHTATVFVYELSTDDLVMLEKQEADNVVHGVAGDSERTYRG